MTHFFNKIIHFSVYHRGVMLILIGILAVLGWMSFQNIPIDVVPDVTNIQVQINSAVEGMSSEEGFRNPRAVKMTPAPSTVRVPRDKGPLF